MVGLVGLVGVMDVVGVGGRPDLRFSTNVDLHGVSAPFEPVFSPYGELRSPGPCHPLPLAGAFRTALDGLPYAGWDGRRDPEVEKDPRLALVDRLEAEVDRRLHLPTTDLRALSLLEDGPLSAATIADRLGLTRAGVTAVIDRLEAGRSTLPPLTSRRTDARISPRPCGSSPAPSRMPGRTWPPLGRADRITNLRLE